MKRWWSIRIQYAWWHEAIYTSFGRGALAHLSWRYWKARTLPDQYHEEMQDMIGVYCAGGEL